MSSFDLCRSLWSLARLRPEGSVGSVTPSAVTALVTALEAAKGGLVGSGMGIVDIAIVDIAIVDIVDIAIECY